MLNQLKKDLSGFSSTERKEVTMRFFKTGKGEYGEGDIFIGVRVPDIRKVASTHRGLGCEDLLSLLQSPIHEYRLCALLILVYNFEKSEAESQQEIFQIYMEHRKFINSWDLVDLTAPKIVGCFLFNKDQSLLLELASSQYMWDRRIAMVASYYNIQMKSFVTPLKLAKRLLHDEQDLMHKAVGWMLREIGKKDRSTLDAFLKDNAKYMARTTLRYAIEKHPEKERKALLKVKKI